LEFSANQGFRYANSISTNQPLTDSKTWTAIATANYQLSPSLSVGPSLTFAYDNLKIGSDMISEQFQGQFSWRPGQKLTCLGRGGIEIRQFLGSNESDLLTPVFDFSLAYRLFEATTFSLAANRTVRPSYFGNQLTETYSFNGGVRQRLLQRLYLDVTGGYATTTYRTTSAGESANRDDDYATVNIRLSCPFLQHGSASVFYNWSDNTSSQSGFGYNSNQVGVEIGYRF
jgi:Putative beta-barrel porin 2